MRKPKRVAIIGAGMAGLTCARALQFAGHEVVVFDKARGPGGRMATRRGPHGNFDHGAQYFTARDPAFAAEVQTWLDAGVVAQWSPRILDFPYGKDFSRLEPDYVGFPRMSALTRYLARDLDLRTGVRITRIEPQWRLFDGDGEDRGAFDAIILAIPAPQAIELLRPIEPELARGIADEVNMLPCWAVMATFADRVDVDFDAASINHLAVQWIAHDASKPGREPGHRWVLHADPYWSLEHIEDIHVQVIDALLGAMSEVTDGLPELVDAVAHRWRYARVSTPLGAPAIWNAETGLGLCGDWFHGPRVEGAWLSGRALAALV